MEQGIEKKGAEGQIYPLEKDGENCKNIREIKWRKRGIFGRFGASLTVEAALILPALLSVLFFFLSFLQIIRVEQKLYYTATQVMIVKEDSDIAAATDMADKKICVVQGYTGEICVQNMGYSYEAFKKGTEAVLELVNGKCDVVVIDSATAQKYVGDNEGLKIVEDPSAFESEEYAIAVQKGNTELLDKINSSIDKMLADGTVNELAVKYTEEATAE